MQPRPKQSKHPKHPKQLTGRRRQVERILYDMGWEDFTRLDEWDGEDLEFLRKELNEEEFRSLLDGLVENDGKER
jgi:hypothetical protein